jgi:hypothetical protein
MGYPQHPQFASPPSWDFSPPAPHGPTASVAAYSAPARGTSGSWGFLQSQLTEQGSGGDEVRLPARSGPP